MAVPKSKVSRSRRNMRRSHDALSRVQLVQSKDRGELCLPHHISPDGYYKGRCVIDKSSKVNSQNSND